MYVLVSHSISMPAEFWGSVPNYLFHLRQDGVKRVICVFPNENMDQCTSVWEVDSIETLNGYLKNKVGDVSMNRYYQINEANAIGLTT